MISSQLTQSTIYCTNPECEYPINQIGNTFCAGCQTPLIRRYLWAVGDATEQVAVGEKVAERYEVISPRLWLDSKPGMSPYIPETLPAEVNPYSRLYFLHLHVPQVYGFTKLPIGTDRVILLDNLPVDETGGLYPSIVESWEQVTAVRQVYWLWQILQLWTPLKEQNVASSLLVADNLRVQGWCVRLLELTADSLSDTQALNIKRLAESWQPWIEMTNSTVSIVLKDIVTQMQSDKVELKDIQRQLNQLLLSLTGELPLSLEVVGATDTGPILSKNEDTCFPLSDDSDDSLLPNLTVICDGIGGHEGGEVASKLAVQSVKLQVQAFLNEIALQKEATSPDLLEKQLEASLRVVNNLIYAANKEQNRVARERMATTIVMGVQVPQSVQTFSGRKSGNAHELYIANVGDSRAYWITAEYCQLLTVDDDVVGREVRSGRRLYQQALQCEDASALTQALGTKDGESLHPSVQRFIIEEDGLLLLCSDGLSDNNWVKQSWRSFAIPVLAEEVSLKETLDAWIQLANMKNGHDNTSIVLVRCRVSPEYPFLSNNFSSNNFSSNNYFDNHSLNNHSLNNSPNHTSETIAFSESPPESEVDQNLTLKDLDLDLSLPEPEEDIAQTTPIETASVEEFTTSKKPKQPKNTKNSSSLRLFILSVSLLGLIFTTAAGIIFWRRTSPKTFKQTCEKLPGSLEKICPTQE